ncbi:TPR repeat-containing thioredoxin TDX [Carica papaya]|uniref:TPR repeat-containing thioredoxin TDX n=1 Tax=Carica papaya TaxID=3649 RepID=UPI000B8D08C2|nr:TPR repeat-containing thioredoxin TDX [Carica papaya]
MDATKIADLKVFVDRCNLEPSILHDPSLSFFRNYLQRLGARLPQGEKTEKSGVDMADSSKHFDDEKHSFQSENDDEIFESDIELDDTDAVEPDNDPPQKMGNPSVEVPEENRDGAQLEKIKAVNAISEGKLDEAMYHLTEAIMLNPTSAILYATRAGVFVQLKKPNAAIRDADAALQINPDSAKGYKMRGLARAMLGQWEAAASDLHTASKLDYDEEIGLALKKVEPNVHKIEEHRRKYERMRKEVEVKRADRERRQREEAQVS